MSPLGPKHYDAFLSYNSQDRWPLLPMTIVSVGPTTDVRPPK